MILSNIQINQEAIFDNHWEDKINADDIMVFNAIIHSSNTNQIIDPELPGEWKEIDVKEIKELLPLMKNNSEPYIWKSISKLSEINLIEMYPKNSVNRVKHYKIGKNCEKYFYHG